MAATLAASLAVGVGVALTQRERRGDRRRHGAERRFGLLAGETTAAGLRRMALGELDDAIDLLERPPGAKADAKAIHETRKTLKRLRTLVRLLRDQLGEDNYARENAALRDAGRTIAQARDAEVLVDTLDGLMRRHPRKLGGRNGMRRLRSRLASERDRARSGVLEDPTARAQLLTDLRAIRARIDAWQLPERPGIELTERALERLYRQGRARRRRAKRARRDGEAMHAWRKRVKDLRYAAEALDRVAPAADHKRAHGGRGAKRSAAAGQLRTVARRADDLSEMLGHEHDLALLAAGVESGRLKLGRGSRKALLGAVDKRRRRLRKRALADGRRLYGQSPRQFVRRVRRAALSRR